MMAAVLMGGLNKSRSRCSSSTPLSALALPQASPPPPLPPRRPAGPGYLVFGNAVAGEGKALATFGRGG